MSRLRGIVALLAITVAAGGAGIVLHRLGSLPWLQVEPTLDWLRTTPPGDAVAALARTAGTWCAAWIALSTAAHLASLLLGIGRTVDVTGVFVLPVVRRIGRVALAGALSWPALPAAAVPPPPIVEPAHEPSGEAGEAGLDATWPGIARLPEATATSAEHRSVVVVEPGDNLWRIAERALVETGVDHPTSRQVAGYWAGVIEANRHRLRSGDPDLIYPGEEILLPPLSRERS